MVLLLISSWWRRGRADIASSILRMGLYPVSIHLVTGSSSGDDADPGREATPNERTLAGGVR